MTLTCDLAIFAQHCYSFYLSLTFSQVDHYNVCFSEIAMDDMLHSDVETDSEPFERQPSMGAEATDLSSTNDSLPGDEVSVVDVDDPPLQQVIPTTEPPKPDWRSLAQYLRVDLKVECGDVLIICDDVYIEDARRMRDEINNIELTDDPQVMAKAELMEDAVLHVTSYIDRLEEALKLYTYVFVFCTFPEVDNPLFKTDTYASHIASVIGTHNKKNCFVPILLNPESNNCLPAYLQTIKGIRMYKDTWLEQVTKLLRFRMKQRLDKEREFDERRLQYLIDEGLWPPLANSGCSSDDQGTVGSKTRRGDACRPVDSVCELGAASSPTVSTCESGRWSPDGSTGGSRSAIVCTSKEKSMDEGSLNIAATLESARVEPRDPLVTRNQLLIAAVGFVIISLVGILRLK